MLVTGRGQAALLWIEGTRAGTAIDYKLWFSDTYVRTPGGWRYSFGQASIALPKALEPMDSPWRLLPQGCTA